MPRAAAGSLGSRIAEVVWCREGVQCTVAYFLVVLVVAPPGELGQLGGRGAPLGDGRPVPSPRLGPFKLTRTDLGCQLLEQAPRQ